MTPGEQLARSVEQLIAQVSHWTPPRWVASSAADRVYTLVQQFADLEATVVGGPAHVVPRLDSDLALPDQLKVVTIDLLAIEPPVDVLTRAQDLVSAVRRTL